MKTCPICQAVAFDDAARCYGCLHEFREGEQPAAMPARGFEPRAATACGDLPPTFVIKMESSRDSSGQVSWTCTVGPASP